MPEKHFSSHCEKLWTTGFNRLVPYDGSLYDNRDIRGQKRPFRGRKPVGISRARYYDPNVGRFISEDPLGFDGGSVNLSIYADSNPVMNVDPDGLNPFMSVLERFAPYLPALDKVGRFLADEFMGDGRPGVRDVLQYIFTNPQRPPQPINHTPFDNYNAPSNNQQVNVSSNTSLIINNSSTFGSSDWNTIGTPSTPTITRGGCGN